MSATYVSAAKLDREYDHVFGISSRDEYESGLHDGAIGTTYLSTAKRIVERSGTVALLDQWWAEDHADKHAGGAKPHIDRKAALIIVLAHMLAGSAMTYVEMARTLSSRLTPKQAALIGIPFQRKANWYHRIHYAVTGILALIDPCYYPTYARTRDGGPAPQDRITRRRIPTAEQVIELRAFRDENIQRIRQERLDRFCADLINSSVSLAGRHVQQWRGNTALDATFIAIAGQRGVFEDRKNGILRPYAVDVDAGWYSRSAENHAGSDKNGRQTKDSKRGYEAEFAVATSNHPDDDSNTLPYPLLTLAVGFHPPSSISRDPSRMYRELHRVGYPAGFATADRAYSSLAFENYASVLRSLGHDLGMDYRIDQLGVQASYRQFNLVEGTWYVQAMPKDLVTAVKDFRNGNITEGELSEKIESRKAYQLTPKGRPDKDGFQRFTLPDPAGYTPADPNTAEVLKHPTAKTVTIPAAADADGRDKFRQRHPYLSEKWKKWYGLRSTVEHMNAHLKDGRKEDIGNPYRRPGRGYTYQYVMVTIAAVSGNVRKIKTFLDRLAGPRNPTSPERTTRAPRRNPRQTLAIERKPRDGRSTRYPART